MPIASDETAVEKFDPAEEFTYAPFRYNVMLEDWALSSAQPMAAVWPYAIDQFAADIKAVDVALVMFAKSVWVEAL